MDVDRRRGRRVNRDDYGWGGLHLLWVWRPRADKHSQCRSVRVIVVHIRPPGAYFAVLPANVVELGYQLGAIAEGHDAVIDHGLQALRECDDPLVLQRYARRMIRARTMPSATLNGVAPVAAAQRST